MISVDCWPDQYFEFVEVGGFMNWFLLSKALSSYLLPTPTHQSLFYWGTCYFSCLFFQPSFSGPFLLLQHCRTLSDHSGAAAPVDELLLSPSPPLYNDDGQVAKALSV